MLLDYLVPARGRRQLLRALRSNRGQVTIRQLALEARVPYSSAHREVLEMRHVGLVRTKRVGGSLACSWDAGSPEAKALAPLLESSRKSREDRHGEDPLYRNLKRWGAPLVRGGRGGADLSLEETLAHSLALARRDPAVARVWPPVLAKNRRRLALRELASLARRLGEKKALGFFLSLTGTLLKERAFLDFARTLRDRRFRKTEDFFHDTGGARARSLAEKNTPRLARDWFFRMNMPIESFASLFRKFVTE